MGLQEGAGGGLSGAPEQGGQSFSRESAHRHTHLHLLRAFTKLTLPGIPGHQSLALVLRA